MKRDESLMVSILKHFAEADSCNIDLYPLTSEVHEDTLHHTVKLLREAGYIEGHYNGVNVDGQPERTHWYGRITWKGYDWLEARTLARNGN